MKRYKKSKSELIDLISKFKDTDDLFFLADAFIVAATILKQQEFPITEYVRQK